MTGRVGIVMLCHTALDRAAQVARHWAAGGCPVVIHLDKRVTKGAFANLRRALADLPDVRFCARHRCEWGSWSLVAASQTAAEMMLAEFSDVSHVYLASGSCLPLRPVAELQAYLDARPDTDFIESVTTQDVEWTVGGLNVERFMYRFPFAWKRNRFLFDRYVRLQRRLGLRRKLPQGVTPHLGSQWWCLTRRTLAAILQSPARAEHDRFFRLVWIPDESYYQTLARKYAIEIESRSLTLSKFDFQGKPHVFYDDHLHLLRRSDCFVARKIWPRAERLYDTFLNPAPGGAKMSEPAPGKIDRVFAKAHERRTRGRPGLYMQSRFPNAACENDKTCAPYSVFCGFNDLFEGFEPWLALQTGARVHGNLFDPEGAQFAGRTDSFTGCLPSAAKLRDYNPEQFLASLIWNTRGERQIFQFSPRDQQKIARFMAADSNAQIALITGAWAVPLFHARKDPDALRQEAALLQRREVALVNVLRRVQTRASVRIWTLAEFLEEPIENLFGLVEGLRGAGTAPTVTAPPLADLRGFGQFLQDLKNQGMKPFVMGDFPVEGGKAPRPGAGGPRLDAAGMTGMGTKFDAFVLLAEMRTGSNYLEGTLNDFPDLIGYGEVFNPNFMGRHNQTELFGIDMVAREADPLRLIDAMIAQTPGLPGFRFFHDHDPRVLDRVLPDPRIAKIILTRNPLDSYVSRKIAAATGQWRMTDMKHRRPTGKIRFVATEFDDLLAELHAFQLRLQRGLQVTGQTAFHIAYDDITDLAVINGLARFLGSGGEITASSSKLKKQNPSDLSQKVENHAEMLAHVAAMDRFDLSRTPHFEPARHPGVPGFYALPETGLLFMPIKGAPVDAVVEWMAALEGIAPGELRSRMTQKELRQWLRAHPGHRSFTVLRHPVARAYETFNRYILPNDRPAYSDARRVLRRMYGLPIPRPGLVDGYGPAEHRAAFLAFLDFLKGNLQGQTGLRVDTAWATQTALLQGMAQVTLPDVLIREEDMPRALPALAGDLGRPALAAPTPENAAPFPLAQIHDAQIEAAAQEAYRRDYLNFGYGPWRAP